MRDEAVWLVHRDFGPTFLQNAQTLHAVDMGLVVAS